MVMLAAERCPIGCRAALYLGGHRVAAWASDWDDEDGRSISLGTSVRANAKSSLLSVTAPQADYTAIWILRIKGDSVEKLGEHGIDYGAGDFTLDVTGNAIRLRAAPTEHLELRGVGAIATVKCSSQEWPGTELLYDVRRGQFVRPRPICIARHG